MFLSISICSGMPQVLVRGPENGGDSGIWSAGCVAGAGQSPSYLVLPPINLEVRAV